MSTLDSPMPLSEIESILAWVDTFKLSRPTKKINRDFSDAVLLAEILNVHYPKLVEMHNYPPRNSHSLKLNNWLTLNRKVLKKLKLNLCINTMEQLANCNNGVIERVLVMVREKIRRDEELNKSTKESEQNTSSGGSFYEACGEDENILVVPVKVRVNGVLETVQQKVVNYDAYLALKEELKDSKDSADLLKQKVEHLDSLIELKQQRVDELQKQLDRKQTRRKEAEAFQNSLQIPFETVPSPPPPIPPPTIKDNTPVVNLVTTTPSLKSVEANVVTKEESKIPIKSDSTVKSAASFKQIVVDAPILGNDLKENTVALGFTKLSYTKLPSKSSKERNNSSPSISYTEIEKYDSYSDITTDPDEFDIDVDRIKSDVFKEIEIIDDKLPELEEFKDSEQETATTIEQTIQKEIKTIANPLNFLQNLNS